MTEPEQRLGTPEVGGLVGMDGRGDRGSTIGNQDGGLWVADGGVGQETAGRWRRGRKDGWRRFHTAVRPMRPGDRCWDPDPRGSTQCITWMGFVLSELQGDGAEDQWSERNLGSYIY